MKIGGPRSLDIAGPPLPFPLRVDMARAGVIPREGPRIMLYVRWRGAWRGREVSLWMV